jgi:DNA polymerase-3 subunit gamma/tau
MGLSAAGTLEEMAGLLQQMAVEQVVPGALDDTDPDQATARSLAPLMPPDETQLLYGIVVHGRAELSLLSDAYAALTMVLLRLLAFPAAGGGAVAAAAPRAAPLVATPREARSAVPAPAMPAVARPAAATPAAPVAPPVARATPPAPVQPPKPAAPVVPAATQAAASTRPAPPQRPPVAAPAARPAPAPRAADEPPPWADEALPDDIGAAESAGPSGIDEAGPADVWGDEPAPQTSARLAAPAPAALPPLQRTPLGDRWSDLVRPLAAAGSLVAMVRELAWQAEPLATGPTDEGGLRWQLRVERESLRNPTLATKLAAALTEAQGRPVTIEVVVGAAADSMVLRDTHAREAAQRAAEQLIQDDPEVRAVMAQFRTARIVPGSIKPLAADGGNAKAPPP